MRSGAGTAGRGGQGAVARGGAGGESTGGWPGGMPEKTGGGEKFPGGGLGKGNVSCQFEPETSWGVGVCRRRQSRAGTHANPGRGLTWFRASSNLPLFLVDGSWPGGRGGRGTKKQRAGAAGGGNAGGTGGPFGLAGCRNSRWAVKQPKRAGRSWGGGTMAGINRPRAVGEKKPGGFAKERAGTARGRDLFERNGGIAGWLGTRKKTSSVPRPTAKKRAGVGLRRRSWDGMG